ncbi:MAG: ZIP family metal transporter [Bacillota bacterium]
MEGSFVLQVTLIGFFAGVLGTLLGGVLGLLFKVSRGNKLSFILGFAAGIMMAIVFLELILETMEMDLIAWGTAGLVIGVLVFLLLDFLIPHHHTVTDDGGDARFLKKGTLLTLGIGLHNLPEGLAIGAGFAASSELGVTLALVIALHNIPEGLAVATPLVMAKISKTRVLLMTAGAGLPMAVGAFLGGVIGNISLLLLAVSLGFAGGAMLYIVCDELIPDAYEEAKNTHWPIMGILIGVVMGIILINVFG